MMRIGNVTAGVVKRAWEKYGRLEICPHGNLRASKEGEGLGCTLCDDMFVAPPFAIVGPKKHIFVEGPPYFTVTWSDGSTHQAGRCTICGQEEDGMCCVGCDPHIHHPFLAGESITKPWLPTYK